MIKETKWMALNTIWKNEKDYNIKNKDGKNLDVPESGSLGLLAIGHRGLIAWRKKRFK